MEMDYISLIKRPITDELDDFNKLFDEALSHTDGMLAQALDHIRRRTGKRMEFWNKNLIKLHYADNVKIS